MNSDYAGFGGFHENPLAPKRMQARGLQPAPERKSIVTELLRLELSCISAGTSGGQRYPSSEDGADFAMIEAAGVPYGHPVQT